MKYWTDDVETYAANDLQDVFRERGDYWLKNEEWEEVSSWAMAWTKDLEAVLRARRRGGIDFFFAKIKWYRPLWWFFAFHRPKSNTGKAWFISSTEF